jgi:hypothetical protein
MATFSRKTTNQNPNRPVAKKTTPRALGRPPYSSGHRGGNPPESRRPQGGRPGRSAGRGRAGQNGVAAAGRARRQGHGWWQVGRGRRLGAGCAAMLPAWCPAIRSEGLQPSRHTAETCRKHQHKQGKSIIQIGERGGRCASFRRILDCFGFDWRGWRRAYRDSLDVIHDLMPDIDCRRAPVRLSECLPVEA